ncbi:zonular occludens toxin domain-containing protein, partial [Alcanivorax sp.]|uniref:zonular occludens toxin domain-containing protein n=1 Tax=Alcanivorax sp. TaxID=1872427 RepID=UPI000C0F9E1F
MFWLVTGKPGTGKTSHTLDFVLHDKRFAVEGSDTRRPVYYRGIRDLKVDWHELTDDQVKEWPDHLPQGAVLVVDEAQQIWPGRAPSKPVPPGLTALETHRHQGWDIIFISQDPSLLDTHARKLCNEQLHYSRPFGAPFVIEYHSGSGYVNPSSKSELGGCVQRKKGLPKRVWDLYHSAEVHTHKFKPPKIIYFLIAGIALAAFLLWRFTQNYGASTDENYVTGQPGTESHQVAQVPVRNSAYSKSWSELMQPEVQGLPYTAPLYELQAKQPTAIPVVHGCMSMESDFSDCRCYTQQGTTIADMPWQMCRRILKHGIFNHLAQVEDSASGQRRGADGEA